MEWHMNGEVRRMITNYLPLPESVNVPPIIRELRAGFDERMMDLYGQAMDLAAKGSAGTSETVHVEYTQHGLHVTAVHHLPTGQFTQLIARGEHAGAVERPDFTISLFLAAVAPGTV
jgi:hypothetical protein